MKKFAGLVLGLAGMVSLVPAVHAQATYTASRIGQLQAGAGFMYLNNDYTPSSDKGGTAWVDFSLTRHIGLEAEGHAGVLISPSDYGENSFFGGPRFFIRKGKFTPYVKAMIGEGLFVHDTPGQYYRLAYLAYAYGGGVDYRISPKFNVRAVDVEAQTWPTFSPNNLGPLAVSVGVMYIIH